LYLHSSHYQWEHAQNGSVSPEIAAMVDRLELKLKSHPEDVTGWLLLGRSRLALSQFEQAHLAFANADRAAGHRNVDALVGLSVATLMQLNDGAPFPSAVSDDLEQALKINPDQPDALYYAGISDRENGRLESARARWLRLLSTHPTRDVAEAVLENIRLVDLAMGKKADPELTAWLAQNPLAAADQAAAPSALKIPVRVEIDPALNNTAAQGFILVSAKPPGAVGPPWLAQKVAYRGQPLTVVLTEADALMGQSDWHSVQQLELTARWSSTGEAMPRAGDLRGRVTIAWPVAADAIRVRVDQRVP